MAEAMKFIRDADADIDITKYLELETAVYIANATIAIGDWVALDIAATPAPEKVVLCDVDLAGARCCVGCAMEAAVAGEKVKVLKKGLHPAANCLTGAALGGILYVLDTAPGRADDAVPADATEHVAVGVALLLAADNVAPAWVNAPF